MPAGRFPVSRPGAEVTSPRPREPLLPHRPMSPGRRPLVGKIRCLYPKRGHQALRRDIGDLRPPCPAPRHLFGSGPGRLLLRIPEIRAVTNRRANLASRRRLRKWRIRLLGNNAAMVPDCASPGDDAGEDSMSRTTSRKFLIPLLASAFLAAPVKFGPAMAQHGGSHGVNYNSSKSNSGNLTAGNKTGAGKGNRANSTRR